MAELNVEALIDDLRAAPVVWNCTWSEPSSAPPRGGWIAIPKDKRDAIIAALEGRDG